jgi:hypothetical protein
MGGSGDRIILPSRYIPHGTTPVSALIMAASHPKQDLSRSRMTTGHGLSNVTRREFVPDTQDMATARFATTVRSGWACVPSADLASQPEVMRPWAQLCR